VKVLISAYACSPDEGSEPAAGWNWATALADIGHEVSVVTTMSYEPSILKAGRDDIDFHFVAKPKSRLTRFSPQMGIYDSYRKWQDAIYAHFAAAGTTFDVVHHVTFGSLHLGTQLWRLGAPLVYGPIGGGQTAPREYWRYFGRDWPVEMLRSTATGRLLTLNSRCRETMHNASVVLTTNSDTAAAARRLGASDVRYMLAEGSPAEWLGAARPQPAGVPVVLWIGRMMPRKAPGLAIDAFAELRRAMPAKLVMVGGGPLLGQLQAKVESMGLSEDVELPGRIPFDEVQGMYDTASVLLFTSLRDSSGSQFLEAAGRGLPGVALDLAGIKDLETGTSAIKVPLPRQAGELPARIAAALQTILTDGEWESRSGDAVKWATEWVWPAKAAAVTEVYREVAARSR
jgi:glycosyltransferase involved in cell wall biosynthesis